MAAASPRAAQDRRVLILACGGTIGMAGTEGAQPELDAAAIVDRTTGLEHFEGPEARPLGRVTEGHPTIWSRLPRNPPLDPPDLNRNVLIVPTTAGDDGILARAALATEPDGVIIGTLGAGHLSPDVLELWARAAERIPV